MNVEKEQIICKTIRSQSWDSQEEKDQNQLGYYKRRCCQLERENQKLKAELFAFKHNKQYKVGITNFSTVNYPFEKPQKQEIKKEFQDFNRSIKMKFRNINQKQDIKKSMIGKVVQKNQESITLPHFIEEFCIYGIPEKELQSIEKGKVQEAKVVYSSLGQKSIVAGGALYAFPQGITVQKSKGNRYLQKINEIVHKNYSKRQTFVFSLRSEMKIDIETLTKKMEVHEAKQHLQLLKSLNPSFNLFCICLGCNQFTFQDDVHKNKSYQDADQMFISTKMIQEQFVISQRIYCFVTYFPIVQYFEELLIHILKNIKIQRIQIFKGLTCNLNKIDTRFQLKMIHQQVAKFLPLLSIQNLPSSLPFPSHRQALKSTTASILKLFSHQTLSLLYHALIMQQSLIFICQNSFILTNTIFYFTNIIIKPFKWPFANVYLLPESLIELLEAPQSIIIGIMNKYENCKNMIQSYGNLVFVVIRQTVQIFNYNKKKSGLVKSIQNLNGQLKEYFKQFQKSKKDKNSNKFKAQKHEFIIYSTENQQKCSYEITRTIIQFCKLNILMNLPSVKSIKQQVRQKGIRQNQQLDFITSKILDPLSKTKQLLLKKFCSTQMFLYYIEENYL